jgi:hypothetical protein
MALRLQREWSRQVMKQLLAGAIFLAITMIAFSRIPATVDGQPLLEHVGHDLQDLLAGVHLR